LRRLRIFSLSRKGQNRFRFRFLLKNEIETGSRLLLRAANSKVPFTQGAFKIWLLGGFGNLVFGISKSELRLRNSSFRNFGLRNSNIGILVCNLLTHIKWKPRMRRTKSYSSPWRSSTSYSDHFGQKYNTNLLQSYLTNSNFDNSKTSVI